MADLIYKDEVLQIVGAAFEVYNEPGPGFLEPVYQESMEIELRVRNIPAEPQKKLELWYKGAKGGLEWKRFVH